jgi:hypothetical protein
MYLQVNFAFHQKNTLNNYLGTRKQIKIESYPKNQYDD